MIFPPRVAIIHPLSIYPTHKVSGWGEGINFYKWWLSEKKIRLNLSAAVLLTGLHKSLMLVCRNYYIGLQLLQEYLKGLFINFEYITFFSCPTKRNIFYKRFISIKPLWLEIIEKKGCTKSVRVIYIIYIIVLGQTDFVHPFFLIISSQSGFIEMNLS